VLRDVIDDIIISPYADDEYEQRVRDDIQTADPSLAGRVVTVGTTRPPVYAPLLMKEGQPRDEAKCNMPADKIFSDVKSFAVELRELHSHSRDRTAASCCEKQADAVTSAAEPSTATIGKRIMSWRTALVEHTR
jgi:hypothetical protein